MCGEERKKEDSDRIVEGGEVLDDVERNNKTSKQGLPRKCNANAMQIWDKTAF